MVICDSKSTPATPIHIVKRTEAIIELTHTTEIIIGDTNRLITSCTAKGNTSRRDLATITAIIEVLMTAVPLDLRTATIRMAGITSKMSSSVGSRVKTDREGLIVQATKAIVSIMGWTTLRTETRAVEEIAQISTTVAMATVALMIPAMTPLKMTSLIMAKTGSLAILMVTIVIEATSEKVSTAVYLDLATNSTTRVIAAPVLPGTARMATTDATTATSSLTANWKSGMVTRTLKVEITAQKASITMTTRSLSLGTASKAIAAMADMRATASTVCLIHLDLTKKVET